MSASPSPRGAAWAQENLRRVLNVIGADVTGGELAVPHVFQQLDDTGRLALPELSSRLTDLLGELTGRLVAEPIPA